MAEKPEDQTSVDEKISRANELIGRGTRNYYVNAFAEAADDLSQACTMYADLYGPDADELAHPYLIYAKSLIAVAQDENKLMDIPEEENEDEDGEEVAANGDGAGDENDEEKDDDEPDTTDAAKTDEGGPSTTNGHTDGDDDKEESESTTVEVDANGIDKVEEENAESLHVAWEVLELAVKIFEKRGEVAYPELADAYMQLANISFENSFFEEAIKDYTKSYDIYLDLAEPNRRILAEIQYKIGLCYVMLNELDQSVTSLRKACDIFDDEIDAEKAKDQTEDTKNAILDLEEIKQEITNKIIDVEETKQQSMEDLKQELAKVIATGVGASSASAGASTSGSTGASGSSSSEANKPKPQDISHLIKRKKPEENQSAENEAPPAKKPST